MNEQIEKLAEQAGLEYNFDPMLWLNYEKFAELIVLACMTVVSSKCASQTAYKALADHFGVEE